MKALLIFILSCTIASPIISQSDEREKIRRVCLDYLEGFYEGDTLKLKRSLKPTLFKYGYLKSQKTGRYEGNGPMTFRGAMEYAENVRSKKNFAKPDGPKKVEILDSMDQTAAVKVTAWWGTDYILLAKLGDRWIIEQVLWQGPLK